MSNYRIKFVLDDDASFEECNGESHVYLGAIVEECCDRCGQWATVASLWRIDLMDDDPAYLHTPLDTWIPLDAPLTGYLAQIRDELRDEATAYELQTRVTVCRSRGRQGRRTTINTTDDIRRRMKP